MEFPQETASAPRPITVKQLVYRLRDVVGIAVGTRLYAQVKAAAIIV